MASINDQLGSSTSASGIDEVDPGVVRDRLGAGAAADLYTHDTVGPFWDGDDAAADGGAHRLDADGAEPAAATDDGEVPPGPP